jgi:hypothetical protein
MDDFGGLTRKISLRAARFALTAFRLLLDLMQNVVAPHGKAGPSLCSG